MNFKIKTTILIILGVSIILLTGWWHILIQSEIPDTFEIGQISHPAKIMIDERGIPTIQAENLSDAFKIQGYLMASERLFQIEITRRAARGTLSEILGPATLPSDRWHRILGFTQVAARAWQGLDVEQQDALRDFSWGVNRFIQMHEKSSWWTKSIGIEFEVLQVKPQPWTPEDSLACLLLMTESQSNSWKNDLRNESLQVLSQPERKFLSPVFTSADQLLIPDKETDLNDPLLLFKLGTLKGTKASGSLLDPSNLNDLSGIDPPLFGSNSWVISPKKSKNGHVLLANDPHMDIQSPGYWFPIRFEIKSPKAMVIQGVALPFVPGILLGQNQYLAWGFTNLSADQQDLFREPTVRERTEVIKIRNLPPESVSVYEGSHGPQVRPGYSLAWAALDPKLMSLPMGKIMTATNWDEFNKAFDSYRGPCMNVTYGDVQGNIGWRAAGLIPLRPRGFDGTRPIRGDLDWKGYLAQNAMPKIYNPESGWITTANQRVVGNSSSVYISSRWASPARAQRINQLIGQRKELDLADMNEIQLDTVSIPHRDLMKLFTPFMSAEMRRSFTSWDGTSYQDSELFTQAEIIRINYRDALYNKILMGTGFTGSTLDVTNNDAPLIESMLASQEEWSKAGLGDKSMFLREVLRVSYRQIVENPIKKWGDYNLSRPQHPLAQGSFVFKSIFGVKGEAQSGNYRAVRANQPQYGQSMRFLADVNDLSASTMVLPLGISGHVLSPYRTNMRRDWIQGDLELQKTKFSRPAQKTIEVR